MVFKHEAYALKQLQDLPLAKKEDMSLQRIEEWYKSWTTYEIVNVRTGKSKKVLSNVYPVLKQNQRIESATSGACYVSFSGGKDSTVLADLCARYCKESGSKLIMSFIDTGLEYPEVREHVRYFHKYLQDKYSMEIELCILRPEMPFHKVIQEYGYPVISKEVAECVDGARKCIEQGGTKYKYRLDRFKGEYKKADGSPSIYNHTKYAYLLEAPFKISNQCCNVMKKKPAKRFERERAIAPIIGTMASESALRKQRWLKFGCNSFEDKARPTSNPMSFWTENDVLEYIVKYNIPIASVYGEVIKTGRMIERFTESVPELTTSKAKRTGCMFCCFGAHCKDDNRFIVLKQTHKKQYDFCINGGHYDENGILVPDKDGLGIGKVLDFIGCSNKY